MSDICLRWFLSMIDISLKSLLLAAFTAAVLALFRIRNSNLKHAAWFGVLLAMIGLPLMTGVLPSIPVPLPAELTSHSLLSSDIESFNDPTNGRRPASDRAQYRSAASWPINDSRDDAPRSEYDSARRELDPPRQAISSKIAHADSEPKRNEDAGPILAHAVTQTQLNSWRAFCPQLLMLIWLAGTLIFLTRLTFAMAVTRRLIQQSSNAFGGSDKRPGNHALAAYTAGLVPRYVRVRQSVSVFVPLTVGWLKPTILLPADWSTWPVEKLNHVLAHEGAHVQRYDCATVMVAEVVGCLYWFHPLTWWLRNRLSTLAEECCDDAAIQTSGDRTAYARHLLEIACELCHRQGRLSYTGLAMAQHASVERRILSILDQNRPLSRPLSWQATLLVGTIVLPFVVAAAALKPTDKITANETAHERLDANSNGTEMKSEPATDVAADNRSSMADIRLQSREEKVLSIRGLVTTDEKMPVAEALVTLVGLRMTNDRGYVPQKLADGVTDLDGHYELTVNHVVPQGFASSQLLVRATKMALARHDVDLDQPQSQIDIKLQPEQLIQVRLIDIQGQPASEVAIEYTGETVLPMLMSDKEGKLTIPNIAASESVSLRVVGSDRFAPQSILLNSGWPETRLEGDGTYRGIIRNLKAGETGFLVLAPARFFEGVVLLGDTDKPAANAKISMWASEEEHGSMVSMKGETDANGRFRLNPYPGIRFGIEAYPPAGSPYQIRVIRNIKWDATNAAQKMEIRLPLGVLATGTVVDSETGTPLAKASVQYYPNEAKNKNLSSDLITGWQGMRLTDEQGKFEIPVAAGPGTLLFHAPPGTSYVLRQKGSHELSMGLPGGTRTYAHAFQSIDPPMPQEGTDAFNSDLTIKLQMGGTVTAKLIDQQGLQIQDAVYTSRLFIHPGSPEWRVMEEQAKNGKAEIRGLAPKTKYPVYFLDTKRKLGTTAEISLDDPRPTVILQPCGSATARFVDADRKPVRRGTRFGLHLVVTPQETSFIPFGLNPYLLQPDEDYASNFGRDQNWWFQDGTDENGVERYLKLIPGATYEYYNHSKAKKEKKFVAKSGEQHDMGEITVDIQN